MIWSVSFIWLIWFVGLVSLNQKPDRPDKPNNRLQMLAAFSASCYWVRDRRSYRRIAKHPAATPAANMAPTIQPEEKPNSLGSRRRSSRLKFGIWDSGPSHSSSDERGEPLLKRMVVFLSLMDPPLPCKSVHPNATYAVREPVKLTQASLVCAVEAGSYTWQSSRSERSPSGTFK